MREKSGLEAKIQQLAAKHYGHVTQGQLQALGMPSRTIQGRVESGALVRVHAGVYAVGYRCIEPVALAAAAVLACGPVAAGHPCHYARPDAA